MGTTLTLLTGAVIGVIVSQLRVFQLKKITLLIIKDHDGYTFYTLRGVVIGQIEHPVVDDDDSIIEANTGWLSTLLFNVNVELTLKFYDARKTSHDDVRNKLFGTKSSKR